MKPKCSRCKRNESKSTKGGLCSECASTNERKCSGGALHQLANFYRPKEKMKTSEEREAEIVAAIKLPPAREMLATDSRHNFQNPRKFITRMTGAHPTNLRGNSNIFNRSNREGLRTTKRRGEKSE